MGELVERVDEQDRVLGVVERAEAIRRGWPHRVATIVCRDADGRILVHRRPAGASRFPGRFNWMMGGGVDVGETYEQAAARELAEELGVRTAPRFVLKFLCAGVISPYWIGIYEAVVPTPVRPDPREVSWHDWLTERELAEFVHQPSFVPDGRDAFDRYRAFNESTQQRS